MNMLILNKYVVFFFLSVLLFSEKSYAMQNDGTEKKGVVYKKTVTTHINNPNELRSATAQIAQQVGPGALGKAMNAALPGLLAQQEKNTRKLVAALRAQGVSEDVLQSLLKK